nr:MAG TPA: hypothetical protein [Bacteriophage sp.]
MLIISKALSFFENAILGEYFLSHARLELVNNL